MPMWSHGSEEGFVLTDALVSLFIAGVAAVAVLGFAASTLRYAASAKERAIAIVNTRNDAAIATFGATDDE